ncbi:MAG TPA: hypothetical protein VM536_07240, partial [Chloroflexia bacterium]|nr:hypothetical protein [Chloroflexia bacterium]
MKRWQMATVAAVLAATSLGVAGASLGSARPPADSIVVAPGNIVTLNADWRPPGAPEHAPVIPIAPALPAATGPVLFNADF